MAQRGWLWEPDDGNQPFGSGRFRPVRSRRSGPNGLVGFLVALAAVAVLAFVAVSIRLPDAQRSPGSVPAVTHLTPTDPRIQSFADRTTMTTLGAQTFFDAAPAVEDSAQYSQDCPPDGPGDGSLGCYASPDIHIFNVDDPALDGSMEVTAAHEMLHAAWGQLGSAEQDRLTPLLLSAYDAVKDDPAIAGVVSSELGHYKTDAVDSPQMVNELHSIIGTMASALGPELEAHYALYFADRMTVVALSVQSNSRIDGLLARIGELSATVDSIRDELAQLTAQYDALTQGYNAAADEYNAWAASHSVASVDEISSRQAPLNEFIAQEDAIRAQQVDLGSQWTAASTEWDAASTETNRLYGELDSTQQPVPAAG